MSRFATLAALALSGLAFSQQPPASAPTPAETKQEPTTAKPAAPVAPPDPQAGPWQPMLANLAARCVGPTTMGGRVSDLAVYEKESRIYYVATASGGLWKTENGGLSFACVFEREGSISLGAAAVSQKDPNIVWVGTGEASSRNSVAWGDGVYKSTDGGKTWTHMGLRETHHVSKIAIDPRNPDVVYVGALGRLWGNNDERGLYKTADGGKSWKRVLYVDDKTGIGDLSLDPKNPNVILAATWQRVRHAYDFVNGGAGSSLYKSSDGGKTWKKVVKGFPAGPFGRIGVSHHRKNPRLVVATVEYRIPGTTVTRDMGESDDDTPGYDGGEQDPAPSPAPPPGKQDPAPTPPAKQDPAPAPTPPAAQNPQPSAPPAAAPQTPPAKPEETKDDTPKNGTYLSTDGGETWKYMSTTNPRPFYFSMPRYDPNDEKRVYVPAVNIHYSDDQGKTFKVLRSSVHVDHHAMWIDPNDSNHMIVGQDGGLGVTRDRGATWQMLNSLPIGQFYAIAFDMRKPYWVYGGLQDNGSWAVPTQTRRIGPSFHDAYMLSGGDGFYVQVDPTDWRTVYSESQGGAIVRFDQQTGQQRFIRPRPPQGERYRFNWNTPIHLSPHNPRIVYLGGHKLFRSLNRGDSWDAISPDLSTNDPEKQRPGKAAVAPDIDSGAERHCTIVTISESPMKPGLIWVGTDDGLVQLTRDGGQTWTNLTANIADVPKNLWCSRVTASKYVEGRAYVTFDGHRSNDFKPYLYVTEDYGKTWTSLTTGLPDFDSLYVVREGEKNPDLLFLGSEMSLRVSLDRGKSWSRFRSAGFPTIAVHDLAVHPRELDLVIGTHGRSIWTLNVSALEALTAEALKRDVVVATPQNVLVLGRVDNPIFQGDAVWSSKNTQPGTQICYFLKADAKEDVKITISDPAGTRSQELKGGKAAGLNVVAWNGRISGRLIEAGDYRVAVVVDGKEYLSAVRVEDVSGGF